MTTRMPTNTIQPEYKKYTVYYELRSELRALEGQFAPDTFALLEKLLWRMAQDAYGVGHRRGRQAATERFKAGFDRWFRGLYY